MLKVDFLTTSGAELGKVKKGVVQHEENSNKSNGKQTCHVDGNELISPIALRL